MKRHNNRNENKGQLFNAPVLHSLPEEFADSNGSQRFIGNFIQNSYSEADDIAVFEVRDDAFEKKGLFRGDIVMASSKVLPYPGDLVLASIGEEQFIAIYHPQRDRIRLDRDAGGHRLTVIDPSLPDYVLHGKIIHIFRKLE
ncbi:MAG: hypothetical protein Kow00108_26190 [Calditrichia bacterium]